MVDSVRDRGAADDIFCILSRANTIEVKTFPNANDFNGLLGPSFGDDPNPEELKLLVSIASMCIHHISTSRPNMNMDDT
ncbi:hypothetical protein IEQ34_017909 [Dendrobium chrysotoxum]|uniref:Uncharacterized protein n=1 Tax=Dendrobium chrysotoxum TaxID=161865 RepID=A0AAV7FV38_DENCH|nr:hypothetical protein IEQ34_017909 [Dendrobium chrysotoxum]